MAGKNNDDSSGSTIKSPELVVMSTGVPTGLNLDRESTQLWVIKDPPCLGRGNRAFTNMRYQIMGLRPGEIIRCLPTMPH